MADAATLNTGNERDNAIAEAINAALEVMNLYHGREVQLEELRERLDFARQMRGLRNALVRLGIDLSRPLPEP
jgi:hypothetical protein